MLKGRSHLHALAIITSPDIPAHPIKPSLPLTTNEVWGSPGWYQQRNCGTTL